MTTWISLGNLTLSERRQAQKDKTHVISLTYGSSQKLRYAEWWSLRAGEKELGRGEGVKVSPLGTH